ncbi:(S)-benzoin forming benzil reductase [Metabacillus arenae]|uniref:(S)-benzoin forming benzil reductase n=1 Tax=Metabacillus arenae TaxID=2771434 RepID=A0A926RXN1_9BACI|nr:(S)-benzoin forming benzil reductase [Metabacillus arenae]MBD1380855.1 (S)-benzoin forming benzil reductase [Metabacillus arenae]
MMNVFIVTGASRGLGQALVKGLLEKESRFFCLSRQTDDELRNLAKEKGAELEFINLDLMDITKIKKAIPDIAAKIDFEAMDQIYLINNAGTVSPTTTVGGAEVDKLAQSIHLNYMAPMVLSNGFVKHTKQFKGRKVVVNISSGAANRPVHGWSEYCSDKAGLDMFTKTFGLEQSREKYPVEVISFSPGVMNTGMQKEIRSSSMKDFAGVEDFKELHEKGLLHSPQFVADQLIKLMSGKLENGRIYDIKEFLSDW